MTVTVKMALEKVPGVSVVKVDFEHRTATVQVDVYEAPVGILTGIARTHGRPKKKAKALQIEDLERIVARLASAGTLKAARDNALLQIGFFGGLRRSELVGIEAKHVGWTQEGNEIKLPRSKTDQLGEGIIKAILYSDGPCCPATALRAWLDAAGFAVGAVFRPSSK